MGKTGGSFSRSCRKTKLKDSTLSSECKTRRGTWMATSVNLGSCVTNNNGSLKRGGGYQNSSRRCVLHRGNTLSCQSKNIRGQWKQSSINLDTFIGNDNGRFVGCGKATYTSLNKPKPVIPKKPIMTGGKGSLPPIPVPSVNLNPVKPKKPIMTGGKGSLPPRTVPSVNLNPVKPKKPIMTGGKGSLPPRTVLPKLK